MNSRRPPFPRSGLVPGVLVVTSLLLAGCTTELPVPVADAPVVAAVVSETQERKILEQVTAVIDGAKGDEGAQALEERLSGPALELRRAEMRIAAAGAEKELAGLSLAGRQLILPSEQGWPRSSFVITEPPAKKAPPLLAAFEQPSARDQYKMWGFVYLTPGVTMPQFAPADLGSAAVAADDTSLKISPQDVAQQYASVLSIDDRSKYAESFGDDDLRQYLRDTGESYLAAIKKEDKGAKGTFEVGYEPTKDPVKAVRTADGGAVVLAALASQETLKAEKGWRLTPSTPSAKALWGNAKGTAVMKVVYRDMVALYVPPADSSDQVALLGFHRVPVSVSNK